MNEESTLGREKMGEETWFFPIHFRVARSARSTSPTRHIGPAKSFEVEAYKVTMNKPFFVAVVTLVVVALGGVDAQRRVVRVPRVPRVNLVKKSEDYKNGKSHVC